MNFSRWAYRCVDCGKFRPRIRAAGSKSCQCGCTECKQVEITPKSWNAPTFMKDPVIEWEIKYI